MSIKRTSRLRGIVVAADTQEQAMDHFRAVASGSYQVLESKDGEFAIATAQTVGMQLLNPLNGEEMVAVPEDEKHEMVATASADGDLDAFYQACASGCGSHVFADSEELLQNCPSCASALPQMEDTDLKTNQSKPVKEILLAVASSRKGAAQAYRALATGACETFAAQCDDVMVISNQPLNFDIYKGTEATAVADYVPQIAVASENGQVKAHYLTTAASTEENGQLHIVCSDQSPIFCPATSSGLIDPADVMSEQEKATASDDFSDEDFDEEEEEEDDTEDEEEDEEEEEEEDDSEEEEEEEEEDDDEDLSLSLASDTKKGGVRRKQKVAKTPEVATASAVATGEEVKPEVATAAAAVEPEKVEITASFVAIASTDMKDDAVEVAFAGTIQGEPTWLAFHNGIPFAKAIASAAENPATFADAHFGRAFKAVAAEQGIPAAIEQLRFEEIKPVVSVDAVVAANIATQVSEQTANIAEAASRDGNEYASRFEAALATAAQGVNGGFFKDLKNPIRVAIASTMEELGIVGGDDLLQRAFGEHSDAYNKQLIAKASEILKYDLTVQNQLAQAVMDVEPVNVATASSMSVGRPVERPQQVQQKPQGFEATASSAQAAEPSSFQTKLAGLKFN
jgi:hypothetical protein